MGLWSLTREVNSTDYLFIMAPVGELDVLGGKWTLHLKRLRIRSRENGWKHLQNGFQNAEKVNSGSDTKVIRVCGSECPHWPWSTAKSSNNELNWTTERWKKNASCFDESCFLCHFIDGWMNMFPIFAHMQNVKCNFLLLPIRDYYLTSYCKKHKNKYFWFSF